MPSSAHSRERLAVLAIFVVALACRTVAFLPILLSPTAGVPIGYVDSLYHLRRVELILFGGHLRPPHDLYSAFPVGGDFFWPPLFDYLLAACTWIVTLGDPTREAIQWVGAIVPAFLGALIVWPVYVLGRRVAGRVGGRVAAIVIATLPVHVIYSVIGRADHHGAETLLLATYFAAYLGVTHACKRRRVRFGNAVRALPWKRVILAGLAGFALISVQMGAVLLAGAITVFVALRYLHGVLRGTSRESLLVASCAVQAIAAVVLALATSLWSGPRRFEFVYNQPSLFQPTLLALFAVFPLFLHLACGALRSRLSPALGVPAVVLASGVLFLVLPLSVAPGFRDAVASATGWVTSQEVYLQRVLETRSLFWRDGSITFAPAWGYMKLGLPLAIVGLVIGCLQLGKSRSQRSTALAFTLTWSVCFLVLSIDQVRFVNFFAIPLAIAAGIAVAAVHGRGASSKRRAAGWGTVLVVILASGVYRLDSMLAAYHRFEAPTIEACRWMADNTEDSGSYYDPATPPAYGVITHPATGHHVTYFGKRPATSNPFFDLDGIARSADFLLATSQDDAIRAMRAAKCRFVFISERGADIAGYASLLGDDDARAAWTASPPGSAAQIRLLAQTPYIQLYSTDGNDADIRIGAESVSIENGYDRFRLVYASPGVYRGHPAHAKIFELVDGAVVRGSGRPGATAELRVPVRVDSGYAFEFVRRVEVDSGSRSFEIRSPYPTGSNGGLATITLRDVRDRTIASYELAIPEVAVVSGSIVQTGR